MNKIQRSATIICLFLALVACQQTPQSKSPPAKTDETPPSVEKVLWQLDTTKSQISYISTKNGDIREHNTLRFLTGSINADKEVQLIIDVNSIDTHIDIRNQRMRELFFETEQYPTARIETSIADNLPLMTAYPIEYRLTLKDQQHSFQSPVMIHSGGGEMMVTSAEPVTVNASTFGLEGALDKLREIAGLNSISPEIQVEYKLHFKQIK